MQLITLDNLADCCIHLTNLIQLCKEAEQENIAASENMKFTDWQLNNASLLYLLINEQRFFAPNGCLNIVYHDNKIIAVSGVYISDFSKDIAIAGVRAYTLKNYRTRYVHGDTIFPAQITWAKAKNTKMILLSFNSYNDWLYKFILRGSKGKGTAFGLKFSDTYKKFKPHKKQIIIKHVPQYILKLALEDDYNYDFTSIEQN
ncbi:MAG: hypothetical protein HC836_22765 [Richelia sp. RM2_1_2]|nr:hypothetical protein [Richelia sp. RM2_1_2]